MVSRKKISPRRNLKKAYIFISVMSLILLFFLARKVISPLVVNNLTTQQSLLISNLVSERKEGDFSLQATAHAYDFVSQYIVNGGNIYDVYDVIRTTPELSFLNKAEEIYPDIFSQLKSRQLPYSYSDKGMYIYLAYLETLEKNGYKGITITGPLAFNYAKMAYYERFIKEEKTKGNLQNYPDYSNEEIQKNLFKAQFFLSQGDPLIKKILKEGETSQDILSTDAIFGLVQYATALRYVESFTLEKNDSRADNIFSFISSYIRKGGVPEMYLPVALYDATSLLLSDSLDRSKLKEVMVPYFTLSATSTNIGIVQNILSAKRKIRVSEFRKLDTTSFENIKALGRFVPEFKLWLLENGWEENDFK